MKPLAIDLFCGLGGWTDGLLAEGYQVIGFDIERHVYGEHRYPAQLVIQDVLTLHGSQFRNAALIVASPPCQFFSYCAMPWSKAKALAATVRADPERLEKELALFDACFRIQREACEAAGRHIPMVVENVKGAQPWVGRSRWAYGSFFLWGDVPALMPIQRYHQRMKVKEGEQWNVKRANFTGTRGWDEATKNTGGSWFNIAHNTTSGKGQNPDGRLLRKDGKPHMHQLLEAREGAKSVGSGPAWWRQGPGGLPSKSSARKAASAMIAKIPTPLSRWIAQCYFPQT